jgi:hypothetical protein
METTGLMIAHFSGSIILERILEFAEKTGSLIFWSGGTPCAAVTSVEWLAHIPDEPIEGWKPAVVRNVDELIAAIRCE